MPDEHSWHAEYDRGLQGLDIIKYLRVILECRRKHLTFELRKIKNSNSTSWQNPTEAPTENIKVKTDRSTRMCKGK